MVSVPFSTLPNTAKPPIQKPSCNPPFRSLRYSTSMLTAAPSTVGTVLVPLGPGSMGAVSFRAASALSAVPLSMTTFVMVSLSPATILASRLLPASVMTNP